MVFLFGDETMTAAQAGPGETAGVFRDLPAEMSPNPGSTHLSPVPQQFRRAAKQFRARVLQTDLQFKAVTDQAYAYATAILKRRHNFRQEHLVEIERTWSKTPDAFRCGLAISRDKHSLCIADCRLVASMFRMHAWDDQPEDSLSLDILQFHATPGKVSYTPMVLATISVSHCLGRRFERGFITTDAAITSDLSQLALQLDNLLTQQTWQCDTEHGCWRGTTMTANTATGKQRLLCARSFID